jgi:uncharacterized repeat protein (TIGR03803 family)
MSISARRQSVSPFALLGLAAVLAASAATAATATGSERVLHVFLGGTDGSAPQARLMKGDDGALYGTTAGGGGGTGCNDGDEGCGTVFKLTPQGVETVLYAFSGSSDGTYPWSNLILDGSGNLYGMTMEGGIGAGTVFKLASDGTETVLYDFQSAPDGETPRGNIVADSSGSLYGTTIDGGNTGGSECGELGCGTVFKVAADGTEVVLYPFRAATTAMHLRAE